MLTKTTDLSNINFINSILLDIFGKVKLVNCNDCTAIVMTVQYILIQFK